MRHLLREVIEHAMDRLQKERVGPNRAPAPII